MSFLNPVTVRRLAEEIDEIGIRSLCELARWLDPANEEKYRGVDWLKDRVRVAPSLAARGVADFFDVSVPRFAYRIYLGTDKTSFVNVLRIGTLCTEIAEWSKRCPVLGLDEQVDGLLPKKSDTSLAEHFRRNTCIGDSILVLPPHLEHFSDVAADFGAAYGEDCTIRGTPYVRSLRLSGLCAQAVCFMVTTLMHRHSTGAYSVPEITFFAQEERRKEFSVAGLTPIQIERYFRKVELAVETQSTSWSLFQPRNTPLEPEVCRVAIEGYLRSGFPVLLPVDLARMAGISHTKLAGCQKPEKGDTSAELVETIFASNGLIPSKVTTATSLPHEMRHVILCVGFDGAGSLLCHDPSTLPFLRASVEQINQARPYRVSWLKTATGNPFDIPYRYMSVTPQAVKLSVLRPQRSDGDRLNYDELGLLDLSLAANSYFRRSPFDYGELFLARPATDRDRIIDVLTKSLSSRDEEEIAAAVDTLRQTMQAKCGDRWLWWQLWRREARVMIWDAESSPLSMAKWSKQLVGYWKFTRPLTGAALTEEALWTSETPLACVPTTVGTPAQNASAYRRLTFPDAVAPSLISSFAANGLRNWFRLGNSWPVGIGCDLYCFMQGDGYLLQTACVNWIRRSLPDVRFLRGLGRNCFRRIGFRQKGWRFWKWQWKRHPVPGLPHPRVETSVIDLMAKLGRDDGCAKREACKVARRLSAIWKRQDVPPTIFAMSTFLPEISSSIEERRQGAVCALRFLMHLARELNPLRCDAGQFTVEIVAGSLASGLWAAERLRVDTGAVEGTIRHDVESDRRPDARFSDGSEEREEAYVMNVRTPEVAMERLLDSLRELQTTAGTTGVKLSIECEPGPLYVLGTWKRLLLLCKLLSPAMQEYVGLNVDVAHWAFLKRLDYRSLPGDAKELALLRNLIQSSHFSDHADGGHFGDLVPGEIHALSTFEDWLAWLKSAQHTRFTGLMSGELEACKTLAIYAKMLTVLGSAPARWKPE